MLQVTKNIDEIRAAYNNSDAAGKQLLESLFGKEAVCSDITDQIKSFEDACTYLNTDPEDILSVKDTPDADAYKRLKVITKAINEGWKPDFNDTNQIKYTPWFFVRDGRFVLDLVGARYDCLNLGAHLCFRTRELAEYAAEQFKDLYREFLLE